MDRRQLVKGATAASLGVLASTAMGSTHKHHKGHGHKVSDSGIKKAKLEAIVESSSDCLKSGQACLVHCQKLLAAGDTSMAECQAAVVNMLASCEAMMKVASYDNMSKDLIKDLASTCAKICENCAKACEAHAKHHKECKACLESCKKCIKTCKAIA